MYVKIMNRVSLWRFGVYQFEYCAARLDTTINTIRAWLNGASLGNECKFFGYSTFRKSAKGKLKFGDRCVFRSSCNSNLIGINRPCIFSTHHQGVLTVGDDCGFSGTVIGCFSEITLGNNVRCGANTLITDSDWHLSDPRSGSPKAINIKENVWLGVNVIVLKGVTIGKNTVIGAGSVVTKDIPENVVAAGNPCQVIKGI